MSAMPFPPGFDPAAPAIATTNVDACPVCSETQPSRFSEGYDYELETSRNLWRFWQCRSCGSVWLNPRPSEKELGVIYPPSYYAYDMSKRLAPIIRKGKAFLDNRKFAGILRLLARKPDTFLDVGCGDGRYLRLFADYGVPKEQIFGIELSSPAIPKLRAAGFRIFDKRVEDCHDIAAQSIDLITMFHVIEHVDAPLAVLRRLADWLKPGGVLALETPNIDSLDLRMFKTTWWGGYHIPRHWTLFSETSISLALRQAGLEPLAIRYQTGHSFWLYSIHHMLKFNAHWPMRRAARLFDPMRSRFFLPLFTAFDIVRGALGARTSAMLVLARKAG